MTLDELKQFENQYGLLEWGTTKHRKSFHGTIKDVDEDFILFKIKGMATRPIRTQMIVSFESKEMLPEVTEYNHKDVVWDGGILCYPEDLAERKEINLKR